jgi:hypothetical protein
MFGLEAALRLPLLFDAELLKRDLEALRHQMTIKQPGPDHDGAWKGVSLVARGGDMTDLGYHNQDPRPSLKTKALANCPYFEKVIDTFKCEKRGVRLLSLDPGGIILEHHDSNESVDFGYARVHIPIVSDPRIISVLARRHYYWRPGEVWYGDYTFPHHVRNPTEITRVHLMLDLRVNDWVLSMFPLGYLRQAKLRHLYRRYHLGLHWYFRGGRKRWYEERARARGA